MDKNVAWGIFERTGNVEAYMLYKEQNTKKKISLCSIKENKKEILIRN